MLNISVTELIKLRSANIIDIRSTENYNSNHIPGARNIPYDKLLLNPETYLNKNTIYYIYCKRGITSRGLCQTLQRQGYKAVNVTGGYEEWLLEK